LPTGCIGPILLKNSLLQLDQKISELESGAKVHDVGGYWIEAQVAL
jgi:hypothetical protein